MIRTLGIIKGTLLTPKQRRSLARRLGGKTVLEWVVRLMTDSELLDGVVVVSDDGEDGALIRRHIQADVPVISSYAADTWGCLVDVLEMFPADNCLFIGADWPFVDPTLIDKLIRAAEMETDCDYAAYQFMNEIFSAGRPYGLFPEWYRVEALFTANSEASNNLHRHLPGSFFLDHQGKYHVELLPAPPGLDRKDVRLTCDLDDDWENILTLYDALGAGACEWEKLSDLLDNQPHLRRRVAKLNQEMAVVQ